MDANDSMTGFEVSHQNGFPLSREGSVILDEANLVFNSAAENEGQNESISQAGNNGTPEYSEEKVDEGSILHEDIRGLDISKESRVKDQDTTSHSKKNQDRVVPEKLLKPKNAANMAKKENDKKISSVTSKQPLAIATNRRLPNEKQVSESVTTIDSARATKPASPATITTAGGHREQAKHLKPLKQRPHSKVEQESESASESPADVETKHQRSGRLPSYGFSFKCDERAQKRKEFNAKLEEKIHAKEVEKTTMQAKTQETEEAEIKMLRKSLMFKATPMPSFYHEPAPPKVELKKIPPTQPKSPKLGRHKETPNADSEESRKISSHTGRLSLDEKVAQNRVSKGLFPQHAKKPLRKSLPRLPSENTMLANAAEDATPTSQQPDQPDADLEAAKTSEPGQHLVDVDAEPVTER